MAHGVIHWEIGARHAERLQAFYADLFGWKFTPAGPEYTIAAAEGGGIGGGIMQAPEPMPTYLTFYVEVEDAADALTRSTALGGEEVVAPTPVPGVGRFAMFRDPEGHLVGVLEPLADAAS
ncbi:VOC family protein [Nocardioides sp. QY071]|uniref:VOC family protein n=1 Tax=Nocardioides sp. QY071 TaxID=3044187 RepID=UPI00249B5B9C|nr:VOC family protein [Nocardioides sp. QY071]WGY04527.1 VOC family protein [Nocardioides sp. QY071]